MMTSIGEAREIGRGSNRLGVGPARPCALPDCVAEVAMTGKHGDTLGVVHLDDVGRRELIEALAGEGYGAPLIDGTGITGTRIDVMGGPAEQRCGRG